MARFKRRFRLVLSRCGIVNETAVCLCGESCRQCGVNRIPLFYHNKPDHRTLQANAGNVISQAVGLGCWSGVGVFDEVHGAVAEFAGDVRAHVLVCSADLLSTVRAVGVEGNAVHVAAIKVELERLEAELALHAFADVLAVNSEFLLTVWATHVVANGMDVNHALDLLKADKFRRGNRFGLEVSVEECSTASTVNQQARHVCFAIGAGAPGPCGHSLLPFRENK